MSDTRQPDDKQFDPRPYAAEHPIDLDIEDITPNPELLKQLDDVFLATARLNLNLGIAQERERCARIAETTWQDVDWPSEPPVCSRVTGEQIAARIRSGE